MIWFHLLNQINICSLLFEQMHTYSQVPTINTRQTVRRFGINLTNQPLPTHDRANSKNKRNTTIQPNRHEQWLKMHPQIAPYFKQITERNKINEDCSYITDNYMLWHSDISVPMRQALVGWLISLQYKMRLSSSTLYLAVNILDKYCYQKFISCEKYQLLGLASLFIAAKYQEIKTPRLKKYAEVVPNVYKQQDILNMESDILIVLGFNLKVMTVLDCLQHTLNFMGFEEEAKIWCRYVLDLILLEYWSCMLKPSLVVWAVVALAAQSRGITVNAYLNEQQGKQVIKLVNMTYLSREEDKFKQINCKYKQTLIKNAYQ